MENNTKEKNSGLYVIIASILVLGVIIIGAYFFFLGNNKKVFTSALNNIYNNLNDTISEIEDVVPIHDLTKDAFLLHSKVNIDSEDENLKMFKDYNLSLDFGADYQNNLYTLKALLANTKENILDVNLNYNNQNLYLSSPKLFSKVIEIPNETKIEIPSNNIDFYNDMRNILIVLKDTLDDYITEKDIEVSKEVITINEKKEDVKAYRITLNEEKLEKLYESLKTNISNEKDILTNLAKVLNTTEEELKDIILNEPLLIKNMELVAYREGIFDTFIGTTLSIDDEKIAFYNKDDYQELTTNNLSIIKNKDLTTIDLSKLEQSLETITVKDLKDDKYLITLNIKDSKPVTVNLAKDNDNVNITINYNDTKIKLDTAITYGVKLDTIKTTNTVNIEDLTDEDNQEIISNLTKILSELVA